MNATEVQTILDAYKPIFYLYSKEKYKPSSMEFLLRNANLVENAKVLVNDEGIETVQRGDITVSSPNVTNALLYDLSKGKYGGATGLKTTYLDFPDNVMYGESDVSKVPIYGIVRDRRDLLEISYILNFPYNGPFIVFNAQKAGWHWGDLEHITLFVKKPVSGKLNDVTEVMFGAHGSADGRWVKLDDCEKRDGRIVVYVADHSHALYPKAGMYFRLGGSANDYTDQGILWDPPFVQPLYFDTDPNFNKDTMGWIYYSGRIGYDGISSLVDKYWFKEGEPLPGAKKLKSPPLLSIGQARVYYFIIAALIVAVIVGIIKLGFWQTKIDPDVFFALTVMLFVLFYDRLRYVIRIVS